MPRIDWLRVGLGVIILVAVLAAAWWVSEPWRAQRANKAASAAVSTKTAVSTQKGAAQAVETNAQTEKRVVVVQERERVRTPRVRSAADPYREFLDGVCESRLYKDDQECGGGGRSGRDGGDPD